MTNSVESSAYKRGAELFEFAIEEMRAQNMPDTEIPPFHGSANAGPVRLHPLALCLHL